MTPFRIQVGIDYWLKLHRWQFCLCFSAFVNTALHRRKSAHHRSSFFSWGIRTQCHINLTVHASTQQSRCLQWKMISTIMRSLQHRILATIDNNVCAHCLHHNNSMTSIWNFVSLHYKYCTSLQLLLFLSLSAALCVKQVDWQQVSYFRQTLQISDRKKIICD